MAAERQFSVLSTGWQQSVFSDSSVFCPQDGSRVSPVTVQCFVPQDGSRDGSRVFLVTVSVFCPQDGSRVSLDGSRVSPVDSSVFCPQDGSRVSLDGSRVSLVTVQCFVHRMAAECLDGSRVFLVTVQCFVHRMAAEETDGSRVSVTVQCFVHRMAAECFSDSSVFCPQDGSRVSLGQQVSSDSSVLSRMAAEFSDSRVQCCPQDGSRVSDGSRGGLRGQKKTFGSRSAAVSFSERREKLESFVKRTFTTNIFSKITLIGRRTLTFDDPKYDSLVQEVVDFENWTITLQSKAGADNFVRVDHDYVLKAAELARAGGCSHFHLESSRGADKNSSFLYLKVKGQVEADIEALGFDRFSIYRPGVLLVNREESRPMEFVARAFFKTFAPVLPSMSVPIESVATAMVLNALLKPGEQKTEILENKAIAALGKQNAK
ncbi:hypothetical protein WMY93_007660 [Mugilogobius chulae]|uniref:Uncharacterized protein n=1 Tax=Mugilogobius chulae TaxID=88201 RepID=A0AAW0PML4_9GOBI